MDIHEFSDRSRHSLRRIFDFTTAVNPLGPSNKAKHAIRKGVRGLNIFPDEEVRFLRRYLSRTEHVGEENILFGPGSTALLFRLMEVAKPKAIGAVAPLSPHLGTTLAMTGAEVRLIPPGKAPDFRIDMEAALACLGNTDMLILGRPHGMTGAIVPGDETNVLIEEAGRLGRVLVIDEGYGDYAGLASPAQAVTLSESLFILRTFSLFHGLAGLRLGYGIGSGRLTAAMNKARPFLPINSLAPSAALASLRDEAFRMRTFRFIAEEKAYLRQKVEAVKGADMIDTPCNFVLFGLPGEEEDIHRFFMERQILTGGFADSEGKTYYIRLPVGTHKGNALFMRLLKRVTGG